MARQRKVVTALVLAAVSFGASVLWRRRRARHAERVDLYFEDGSMLSFGEDSDEADRLLPLARRVVFAARE